MILTLLGLIPGVLNLVSGFQSAYFDAKVRIFMARTGAEKDVAVTAIQAAAQSDHETTSRLAIIASNRVLMGILLALIIPYIAWEWSAIMVDIVWLRGKCGTGFDLPCTDPIKGQLAEWGNTIIASVTGSGTALGVAKMYFNRPNNS